MISNKNSLWVGAGLSIAMIVGAPAIADDTELLLVTPDPARLPNPNIMFILDTSSSMTSVEETVAPYDSGRTYSEGTCDTDALYWSETNLVPTCSDANNQWISKSAFYCEFANRQLNGLGSFTNMLVQFRNPDSDPGSGNNSTTSSWNFLQPGDHSSPVECRADSGKLSIHPWKSLRGAPGGRATRPPRPPRSPVRRKGKKPHGPSSISRTATSMSSCSLSRIRKYSGAKKGGESSGDVRWIRRQRSSSAALRSEGRTTRPTRTGTRSSVAVLTRGPPAHRSHGILIARKPDRISDGWTSQAAPS